MFIIKTMTAPAITHVEIPDQDPESLIIRTLCGETCIVFDDGQITPFDFDFYLYRDKEMATCSACRAASKPIAVNKRELIAA